MGLFSRDEATHLPAASGVRLDGGEFALPAGLGAAATLVVISFENAAAPLAGQWTRLGARLAEAMPGLDVLEVVVLPPRMRLLGDMALTGLRTRAEAEQSQIVVVYEKRKPFRKALGIARSSDVTALLVRPDGEIVWRGDGEIDMHEIASLEPQIQALLEGAGSGAPGVG